jgi:3-deoxy-manno-octulosonate cytidylyltransferase (CMP-KDO synthetase)
MEDNYILAIPARLNSSRLPGKPLIEVNGVSILKMTHQKCLEAVPSNKIIILTDSDMIHTHCKANNMNSEIVDNNCLTGTDRIALFAKDSKYDFVVNVQGDEPLIDPDNIKKIISESYKNKGQIINGYDEILNEEDFRNPNIPKVVFNENKELLYMSRSSIPTTKSLSFVKSNKQLGIYSFPVDSLNHFYSNQKTSNESLEDIEILRFLELGFKVKMVKLESKSFSIDTKSDLNRLKQLFDDN